MHSSPTPQTPKRSQQLSQGSPAGSPVESVHHSSVTLEISGHGLQITTAANLRDVQGDRYWSPADDTFFQSDEFAQSGDFVYSPPNRYVTQSRSSNGKLAYVVFAGHDLGVFYNWAACSTATRGFSSKVFKGFTSYEEAHRVWRAFVDHNTLPPDVITSLFGRPPPIPPSILQPNIGGLADPPLLTPHQAIGGLANSPSPIRSPRMPILKRRASDAEDFWVVLTGVSPGVYQGREEGERALGPLASPLFLRVGSREEANQIFVDEYMRLRVARFI